MKPNYNFSLIQYSFKIIRLSMCCKSSLFAIPFTFMIKAYFRHSNFETSTIYLSSVLQKNSRKIVDVKGIALCLRIHAS